MNYREKLLQALWQLDLAKTSILSIVEKENSEQGANAVIYAGYDMHSRRAIATIQAFINHARNPELFSLPDLERAEQVWRELNDYNVKIYEQRNKP